MSITSGDERLRPESLISDAAVVPLPPGRFPSRIPLEGTAVRLAPLDVNVHAVDLFSASHADERSRSVWTYLWQSPFADVAAFTEWLRDCAAATDPVFYAICDNTTGRAGGMASFMRIAPKDGVLEMGHIWFTPALQRTRVSTEALWLMLRYAFDHLGYRRVEWKCDALNVPSRRAALRLGFRFEGIFFRHMIVKRRNRDTAWYAIIAEEWPMLRTAFESWLAPENFDAEGRQYRSLTRTTDANSNAK